MPRQSILAPKWRRLPLRQVIKPGEFLSRNCGRRQFNPRHQPWVFVLTDKSQKGEDKPWAFPFSPLGEKTRMRGKRLTPPWLTGR